MTQEIRINPAMAFQKPLEDYIQYLEKMNLRALPLLEKLAVPGVHYRNPLHDVRGRDAVIDVFRQRLSEGRQKFTVIDHAWGHDGQTVYLRWKLVMLNTGEEDVTNGMAEIFFANDGQVMVHNDYVDSVFHLPPKPTFWSWLKKRYSSASPGV